MKQSRRREQLADRRKVRWTSFIFDRKKNTDAAYYKERRWIRSWAIRPDNIKMRKSICIVWSESCCLEYYMAPRISGFHTGVCTENVGKIFSQMHREIDPSRFCTFPVDTERELIAGSIANNRSATVSGRSFFPLSFSLLTPTTSNTHVQVNTSAPGCALTLSNIHFLLPLYANEIDLIWPHSTQL